MGHNRLCFVIMPFKRELQEIYEFGIKPAAIEAGYDCIRVDEAPVGNILRAIVEHIHRADAIVADLTGHNPNVFYELGIAHATGTKTVMITQDISNLPFDLKSYRVIAYEQTITGAKNLKDNLVQALSLIKSGGSLVNPVQDFRPVGTESGRSSDETERRLAALEEAIRSRSSPRAEQENIASLNSILERLAAVENTIKGRQVAGTRRLGRPAPDLPQGLVEAVSSRRVILFAGAGISLHAGMPSAHNLLETIQTSFNIELPEGTDFSSAMSTVEGKVGRRELVAQLIKSLRSHTGKGSRVHSLIAHLGFDAVVTTNFDTLLEEAYRDQGKRCYPVVQPEELSYADTGDVLLIKIHGSIDRPDSLLVTEEDYRAFEQRRSLLISTLTHYFVTRSILFVGYSLSDENLVRVMQNVGGALGSHRRPAYFVTPKADPGVASRIGRLWPVETIEMTAEAFFEKLVVQTEQE